MATTTRTEDVAQTRVSRPASTVMAEEGTLTRASGLLLMLVVFVGGASVMTIEMAASRLLAPYFGTSLFIWAILIGLVMIYLTVGYWLGGRLADRYPRPSVLYSLTAVAGFATALIPIISGPILRWSLEGFSQVSVGIFLGSLLGVIVLFSVPLTLLGFVSPFAVRLRTIGVASAGGTAGTVSALSTLGSILGTFASVFLIIPNIGTAATLYLASATLLVFSIVGLLGAKATRSTMIAGALLLLTLGLALFAPRGFVKPPQRGELIYEKESAYNYIQVVKEDKKVSLMLNEGHAIHSIYQPEKVLTGGPWDYWLVAPYFSEGFRQEDVKSMAMIGSAAGTAGRIWTEVYGPTPVDGVEIDPDIVKVGRQYFALGELPNVTTYEQDGRTFLQTDGKEKKYTVVGIDAYRQPYIPFHLTTTEFFTEVREHLTPDGAVMINAGRLPNDTRLVDALANTMLQVYPNVYVIDVPSQYNSMVIGTNRAGSIANFEASAARAQHPLLKEVFQASLQKGDVREVKQDVAGIVFTDDKAPIEEVIDQIILGVVSDAGK